MTPIVVLGAGPAGLGAALELARRGAFAVTVLERGGDVGGNAGSFELEGLRVDYGSHRLHPSCEPRILADIRALLGPDLVERQRHGRIRLRGRWVHFPLQLLDLAWNLPPAFAFGVLRDGFRKPGGHPRPETFATVLERGLGPTICRDFYFPYAVKIWGHAAGDLDAEQARRRVSAASLATVLRKVVTKASGRFFYPRGGYGQISQAYCQAARQAGATVRLQTPVTAVVSEGNRVVGVETRTGDGPARLPARQVLSTIPLPALAQAMKPAAPPEVLASAGALKYRAMILVYLALDSERYTEFDAHYFPGPEVAITRLSEPKNYGLAQVRGRTVLCAELPCWPTDPVWTASDEELGRLVAESLAATGLPKPEPLRQVASRRLQQAYPVYTREYREHFDRLDSWAESWDGLLTLGRQGLFAHDNTHHSLAMAYAASECLSATGELDRQRWNHHRRRFERFVVED